MQTSFSIGFRCACSLLAILTLALLPVDSALASPADVSLQSLRRMIRKSAEEFTPEAAERVEQQARSVEAAFAIEAGFAELSKPLEFVQRIDELHAVHVGLEKLVEEAFSVRDQFAALPDSSELREQIRSYLQITSQLIDLSARLRYTLFDATLDAAFEVQPQSPEMVQMIAVLTKHKSSIGAQAIIDELFIPPKDDSREALAAAINTKLRLLSLIATTEHADLVEHVADFIRDSETSPQLVVAAAATIYALGLPQPARPEADRSLPDPPVTAAELAKRLAALPSARLSTDIRSERDRWVDYFQAVAEQGLFEEKYQLGECVVRPGDWLLMRNPSPYNRFTDLAPGLFTHVGVVTSEKGSDGIRRMVLVDLPERGKTIRPVTIDTYVKRTLHYVILRHPDPKVAATMAEAARSVIGNPAQFDLNFRTDRIESLKGKPLQGKTIHTYCAGLLLLCAQQTDVPRDEFFPIEEFAAGGNTVENLAKLGLSFGRNFVSPTGALFAPKLEMVGKRPAMYSPTRDIADQVYDHFAAQLVTQELIPAPDLYQSLRMKLAEAGKANPLLGKALADALDVNENLDLVSAAKAAAVVETLDEVANGAGTQYEQAWAALRFIDEENTETSVSGAQRAGIEKYRKLHEGLYENWINNRLSPRGLRIALVDYYARWGREELDRRFFSGEKTE